MGGKFQGKLRLSGFFAAFTGLIIGKDKAGTDNAGIPRMVTRQPITFLPFIPASSFRGAVRRALKKQYGEDHPVHESGKSQDCPMCEIFGASGGYSPGKATFRDVSLTPETVDKLSRQNSEAYLTEIKIYANMDRVTSQGNSYAVEQIPAGSHFQFEIFYNLYQKKDLDSFLHLLDGMKTLEMLALGGHGSRGLGKIRFGKWAAEGFHSETPQLETGMSLTWYPKKYYESGTDDLCLVTPEEKFTLEKMIAHKEQIASAIN